MMSLGMIKDVNDVGWTPRQIVMQAPIQAGDAPHDGHDGFLSLSADNVQKPCHDVGTVKRHSTRRFTSGLREPLTEYDSMISDGRTPS